MSNSKTILIIESDNRLRSILSMAMEMQGYSVLEVPNENAGKQLLNEIDFEIDCVLHDISSRTGVKHMFGNVPVISSDTILKNESGLIELNELTRAVRRAV